MPRQTEVDAMDYEHLTNLLRESRKHLPASGLRDRIDSAITDEELECPKCRHYWWNHNADGPCAVRETYPDACPCLGDVGRRDALLRVLRAALRRAAAYRIRFLDAIVLWAAFLVGMLVLQP